MKLHVFPASPNARKTLFTKAHLGLSLEANIVNVAEGHHKSSEFLVLNPNAQVPVLEFDDGSSLWESNAIVNRLCVEVDTDLWPKSLARYEIMQWQFWEACNWTPACVPYISKHLFKNESINLEEAKVKFEKYASVLNGHLESNEWLVGNQMTAADISVSAILCYHESCQYPLENYGHIKEWFGKIEKLPAWKAANN